MKNYTRLLLILIILLASVLRFYKLGEVPPSLSWDEVAVGYNAYTIANYGRDEYGNLLPPYFRSFGEDKQPIHIYTTALLVKIFDLSEFSTRLPAALFGVLNVLLIFYLTRNLFHEVKQSNGLFNNSVGLLSSFFLAISPQNIHFSRFNHESNFALFFFMMGLLLFFHSIKKDKNFLPLPFFFFILSIFSYNAAKIAVPPLVLLLTALYCKKIKLDKVISWILLVILGTAIILIYSSPNLLGINRFNQTVQGNEDIQRTFLFKKTQNLLLGRINLALSQYSWHFDPKFLFISGDDDSRLSSQGAGEFYKIDAVFLIIGLIYLLFKRSKEGILVLGWALVGPLPSSLVAEAPHAGRTAFMMGSWHIISALGFYTFVNFFRNTIYKRITLLFGLIILTLAFYSFLHHYFDIYPKKYAIYWQYGMKQVVEYVKENPEYDQVYTTSVRLQPYIFFLYYLKTPLPEFLNTVIYNNAQDKSSNNVSVFGKYYFGGWDLIDSQASKGVLYVFSPSEYDGLMHRSDFDVKKIIYYPNGTTAFYLVSLP